MGSWCARAAVGAVLVTSGCGGGSTQARLARSQLPPAVAISPPEPERHARLAATMTAPRATGVRGRTRSSYVVSAQALSPSAACAGDRDATFPAAPAGARVRAILDPARGEGGELGWCPGRFRGTVTWFSGFACPARGRCGVPPGFPTRSEVVARFSFRVAAATTAGCSSGGAASAAPVGGRDVALGPLVLIGGRTWATREPDAFAGHGYKIPATLPHGVTATLSVPARLRGRLGLVFSQDAQFRVGVKGVSGADDSVRFVACPLGGGSGRTGWPGGIVVARPRCAALVLRAAGSPPVRRRLPLGRPCP